MTEMIEVDMIEENHPEIRLDFKREKMNMIIIIKNHQLSKFFIFLFFENFKIIWRDNKKIVHENVMTAILILLGELDKIELQVIKNDINMKLKKM